MQEHLQAIFYLPFCEIVMVTISHCASWCCCSNLLLVCYSLPVLLPLLRRENYGLERLHVCLRVTHLDTDRPKLEPVPPEFGAYILNHRVMQRIDVQPHWDFFFFPPFLQ